MLPPRYAWAAGMAGKATQGFKKWTGGAIGLTGVGALVGGISPWGTTGGGATGVWSGGAVGGALGFGFGAFGKAGAGALLGTRFGGNPRLQGAIGGMARRGLLPGRGGRLGLYGAAAGALIGSMLNSNQPSNRIRGLHR